MNGLSLFTLVRSNVQAINVTWSTPQSDVPITQYKVQYRKNGTTQLGTELTVPGSPPPTSTILTELLAGTAYNVRVRAVSAAGEGNWSEEQSERTYIREISISTYIDLNLYIYNGYMYI